jgi:hypothetical protein
MADAGTLKQIIEEAVPVIRPFGSGRWALTIGGSHGKGLSDDRSDVDFRLYADQILPSQGEEFDARLARLTALMDRWRAKGVEIDGVWRRGVSQVDGQLDAWLAGRALPESRVWSVWGYHLPCDLFYQLVVEDPDGIVAGWKRRLTPYPPSLREALVAVHMASLRYWRTDYHYASKVARKDAVFLASLTARLVHDIMQVLFALNAMYYVGDGHNLDYARHFAVKPARFEQRVIEVLWSPSSEDRYDRQYATVLSLIDDVDSLVKAR